jgi:hypothetical protein
MAQHPHLFVPPTAEPLRFTSPSSGPRDHLNLPQRDRRGHAQDLIAKLEEIAPTAVARAEDQKAFGIYDGNGIYLAFESEPNFPLKFESLDLTARGIELCTVKTLPDNTTQATVFVPDGKLGLFLKRVTAYRDENTTPRHEGGPSRPKNQDLVESISDIRLAALEALWAEDTLPFPNRAAEITWEIWLRRQDGVDHLARLRNFAQNFNLAVRDQTITFVDRTVVLVRGTARDLSRSIDILGMIAEVRLPKETAAFFAEMTPKEQREWVEDLRRRIAEPGDDAPYICLFDTGLNEAHPVLTAVAHRDDLHTYKPAWGVGRSARARHADGWARDIRRSDRRAWGQRRSELHPSTRIGKNHSRT